MRAGGHACGLGMGCRPGCRFAFGVIPGRAQREPGIQWYLRGARLDPGSALRAVRDDNKKKGAPSGMMAREGARRPG